tara:strand:+ start:470 stop:1075 length:606 start_codon:yes stop_codon:yes gene_type:complete
MTNRKKKLLLIQLSLILIGIMIIFFTYYKNEKTYSETIVSVETKQKIKQQNENKNQKGDVFYNIEYSGFDISGNRYIIRSEEARNNKSNQELIIMKSVTAIFYFKDDTILEIWSNNGIYNNNTLDMTFKDNVRAIYEKSELVANQAEYSNSKSFLSITGKVKVKDVKGTMFADKLLFDIKKKKLNIASFNDNKINANVNLK